MKLGVLAAFFGIIVLMIGGASGLTCFVCSGCETTNSNTTPTEVCQIGKFACVKDYSSNPPNRGCYEYTGTFGRGGCTAGICVCIVNLCNGSDGMAGSWYWSIGLTTVTLWLFKLHLKSS